MPWNKELAIAYRILGGIPDRQIDLDEVVTKPGRTVNGKPFCGTIACGVGWLLMHPRYKARGFGVRGGYGNIVFKQPHRAGWHHDSYTEVASKLLGISEDDAFSLFCSTIFRSKYDPANYASVSDKQQLLARIKNYLKSPEPKMNPENFRR